MFEPSQVEFWNWHDQALYHNKNKWSCYKHILKVGFLQMMLIQNRNLLFTSITFKIESLIVGKFDDWRNKRKTS